jgi:enamine deaminase RidA (YjgF/YER057c/UK114 family)
MALKDSVLAAANHLEAGGSEGDVVLEEETPVVGEQGEEEAQSDDEPVIDPDDLDELSLAEAKKLYKSLKDPSTALSVVSSLAGQMGLLQGRNAPETKQEIKEAKKDVKAILKGALGDEYSFLSDRIGNALDEIFEQERTVQEEALKDLNNQQVQRDALTAMNALNDRTKGDSRKYEAKMVELAKEILPAAGTTMTKYLDMLYSLASAGKQASTVKNEINDKIRRNANDVTGRLRTGGGGPKDNIGFDPNKKYNLKQSIAIAAKQLELQGNRK